MSFTVVQYKRFVQTQMPTAWTNIYTTPAATQDILKSIDIVNASPQTVNVSLCIVPSGGSPGPANALFYVLTLASSAAEHWTGTQVMNAGDSIYVQCNISQSATVTASGLEAT
jgi:hypothetical protein